MPIDDAELVGGVLVEATDPRRAAHALAEILEVPTIDGKRVREMGFDPELVNVLHGRLGADRERIGRACAEAAAWVLGRRSIATAPPWELVASLPTGTRLPVGLSRTTGETMLGLVSGAQETVRLTAPFVDQRALAFLADALVAATLRGVGLEIFCPSRSARATDDVTALAQRIERNGGLGRVRLRTFREDAPWAHLKVLTADSIVAYIGSANVTAAALAGPNLELGVLVRGLAVGTIEAILEMFGERR